MLCNLVLHAVWNPAQPYIQFALKAPPTTHPLVVVVVDCVGTLLMSFLGAASNSEYSQGINLDKSFNRLRNSFFGWTKQNTQLLHCYRSNSSNNHTNSWYVDGQDGLKR